MWIGCQEDIQKLQSCQYNKTGYLLEVMKYKTTGCKHSNLLKGILQDRKYTCKHNIEARLRNHP